MHEISPIPSPHESQGEDASLEHVARVDVLQPGIYWRVKPNLADTRFQAGDLHLLLAVHVFDGAAQSVDMLSHPGSPLRGKLNVLIDSLLQGFEPVSDEEARQTRELEQGAIMSRVQEIQDEMTQAQSNPLALPEVQAAAERAVENFESTEASRVQAEVKVREQREADLRRIHRRAARRSEAKGNPLSVRHTTISDSVEVMIADGLSSDGLRELSLEAGRRIAIAESAAAVLKNKAEKIGELLKSLTPFFAEKSQVAIAKSSAAIQLVKDLEEGITSLKLYTGDTVSVVTVRSGEDAASSEPLCLLQAKRFMDAELAVWADVADSFDWTSQDTFFEKLRSDDRLLNQVLPTPRCVVSMAVTSRQINYSASTHWYDRMVNELRNKTVFLLVRNGGNVYAVYSEEGSHEASPRLFPTQAELQQPFNGIDGTKIGLKDIRFAKSAEMFERTALSYKRFLILLAGLDHREKLFGDFYPREQAPSFMSLDFQQRYFRFVADEETAMLSTGRPPRFESAQAWVNWCNSHLRSGSRVLLSSSARNIRFFSTGRRASYRLTSTTGLHIASSSKGYHCIELEFATNAGLGDTVSSQIWLDGPDSPQYAENWFLCLDRAKLPEVEQFLYQRSLRPHSLSVLRLLRRAQEELHADHEQEAELRCHLRSTALEHKVRSEEDIADAIDEAISLWRAAHRGAQAPGISDTKEVNALLTAIYPKDHLRANLIELIRQFCEKSHLTPLKITINGDAKYAVYCPPSADDVATVEGAVHFGWVRRYMLSIKGERVSSTSNTLIWLNRKNPSTSEEDIHCWPGLDHHLNEGPEPVSLNEVKKFLADMHDYEAEFEGLRSAKSGAPCTMKMSPAMAQAMLSTLTRKALYPNGYYRSGLLRIPVAIVQKTKTSAPRFIYLQALAAPVINLIADENTLLAARQNFGHSQAARDEWKSPVEWRLVSSSARAKPGFTIDSSLPDQKIPHWSLLSINKNQRRAIDVRLNLNRAFDALMGRYAKLRVRFYKELKEKIKEEKIWRWSRSDASNTKALISQRYEYPRPAGVVMSALVWDKKAGRSIGNRHFSRMR